jgi:predicted AlkP superfamily pyrophosphatase or phosphodiesterase
LTRKFGTFPLFNFWGPNANIASTQWIANAARYVHDVFAPTLNLVYLPHLDYALQKLGPDHPEIPRHLAEVDAICGELIDHVRKSGVRVVVLSEYGIMPVTDGIHINRALRRAGLIRVREELGRELLDPGASEAFAVSDHQVAHIYVRDPARIAEVRALIEGLPGVDRVLDDHAKREFGLAHPRSGELVALSKPDRWFTYYYWLDDARAPDFARCVEIHRKPGYDPVELFLDPKLVLPKAQVAYRVAKKLAGFRYLMDVIPLDATLVRGSHGRVLDDPTRGAIFITSEPQLLKGDAVEANAVKQLILDHLFN